MAKKAPSKKDVVTAAVQEQAVAAEAVKELKSVEPPVRAKKLKVVYPEKVAMIFHKEQPLTIEIAKEMLGWTEPKPGQQFTDFHLLVDGVTVYCSKIDAVQRSIKEGLALRYRNETLNRFYKLNGETIIIGEYGSCLDGQHRLLGLIYAVLEYRKNPSAWPKWDGEPYIESFVACGVSEDPEVVNTINTGKERTLADAIHTSRLFKGMKIMHLNRVCRVAEFAIKTIWDHVGEADAYSPKQSHSKAFEFFQMHPRLVQAISLCYDMGQGLTKFVGSDNKVKDDREVKVDHRIVGLCAALMYLMAAGTTDPEPPTNDGYWQVDNPSENQIDFSQWEKAVEFFTKVADYDDQFASVRKFMRQILEESQDDATQYYGIMTNAQKAVLYQRTALLIKAWSCYVNNHPLTPKNVALKYRRNEHGAKELAECPTCAGIDYGFNR